MMRSQDRRDDPSTKMEKPEFEDLDVNAVPWWTSKRFTLAVICFFGTACLQAQRVNLSIAMLCMVNQTATDMGTELDEHPGDYTIYDDDNNTTRMEYVINIATATVDTRKCPFIAYEANDTISLSEQGELIWSKEAQGLLLGAYFWGYILLQLPGGWLSDKFGSKKVIALGMIPGSVVTLLTPISANASPWFLLAARILIGLGHGLIYPAIYALWTRWGAPWERSRLIGISLAGGELGIAVVFPVSGFLCDHGFGGGWPSVFYVLGISGVVWCIIWIFIVHESPRESPNITEVELKYIEQSVNKQGRPMRKELSTPWKSIFTSPAVWAIIVVHTSNGWGVYFLLTSIPTYMKEVLKFDIKQNGLFTMLPYLCSFVSVYICGFMADFLIEHRVFGVVLTRKLFSTIGLVVPGALLVMTGFMTCNEQAMAVAFLTLAMAILGFTYAGYLVNHSDIAPPFAGTLFAITNVVACIPGILAPYIVGAVTPQKTQEQWLVVFYITGAIYLFGAVVYFVFGKGEVQAWAVSQENWDEEIRIDTESVLLRETNVGDPHCQNDAGSDLLDKKKHQDISGSVSNDIDSTIMVLEISQVLFGQRQKIRTVTV